MRYWGELKSLRGQSVGEIRLVMRAVFRICGKEKQDGPTNSRKAGYAPG